MPLCYDNYKALPELRNGKTRQQPQTFMSTEPFSGPVYTQLISDDTPVMWECEVTCAGQQAEQFQAFLLMKDDNGTRVIDGGIFTKSILTESGFIDHDVFMISTPTQPAQNRHIWGYSFTLYAEKLNQPDYLECSPSLVLIYGDDAQSSAIDRALNSPTVGS